MNDNLHPTMAAALAPFVTVYPKLVKPDTRTLPERLEAIPLNNLTPAERDAIWGAAIRIRNCEQALEEVEDLIDGYVDVEDGDYGQPYPNKAMRAQQIIDAVLGRRPA